jgi:ubiquinone biosynthesis O-methyltransferase
MKVLDVGCGAGILAESLGRLGMGSVTGIDPVPKCIELAEAHLSLDAELSKSVNYRNVSIEHLISEMEASADPDAELYDLVCCSEVIEHVENQRGFLHKCIKMLKPGGLFFLSSIAKTPEGWFLNIVMGEYVLGLLPKGTHEWNYLISQETVQQHLEEVGCQTIDKKGATILNPITREMGEIPYLRANYLMMAKKGY